MVIESLNFWSRLSAQAIAYIYGRSMQRTMVYRNTASALLRLAVWDGTHLFLPQHILLLERLEPSVLHEVFSRHQLYPMPSWDCRVLLQRLLDFPKGIFIVLSKV